MHRSPTPRPNGPPWKPAPSATPTRIVDSAGALVGVALLAIASLIAGFIAIEQRERSETNAAEADSAGKLAEARRLGTQALVVGGYDQALLLAVEGRHLEDTRETRSNLLAAIQRSTDAIAVIRSETEAFLDLGFTPDGKNLLASGIGGPPSMSRYDVSTRRREASIEGPGPSISSTVSPDGRLAVMSS